MRSTTAVAKYCSYHIYGVQIILQNDYFYKKNIATLDEVGS